MVTPPDLDIDPFSSEFLSDPQPFHVELRDAGPVVRLRPYGVYATARYAEVTAVLHDAATYCSSRGVGLSDFEADEPWRPPSLLLETDPPEHDRTRRLMNHIVSNQAIREIRAGWRHKAQVIITQLTARRRFDAIKDLAEVYPLSVFPDVIGIRTDGRANLLLYASAVFNAFGPRNALLETTERDAARAVAWVNDSCRRDMLLPGGWGRAVFEAVGRGECTEQEAERLVRSFLSAGVDTTVNGIGNMIHAFLVNPGEWQRLRGDPSLLKRAIEESLRWGATVQTFFRTTTRDANLSGVLIPAGSKVLLFLAAANRDPRRWQNAEAFDITRQSGAHVGFGYGIHRCLGQMVARLEMEAVLEALLHSVESFRLAGSPQRRLNNTLHAYSSLPIEVTPT